MPSDSLTPAAEEAAASAKRAAKDAVASVADKGQQRLGEAIDLADRNLREAAKRAQKAVREGVETLKTQAAPYRDNAGQQIEEAQKFVIERVKERPVTATLAGLGVGLLLGLLLANRPSK